MPLSEHEQRVLEQIERDLYADDPKFAAAVRGIDPRARQRRRYIRVGACGVAGVALIPVGIVIGHAEVAVVGVLLVVLACVYGLMARRHTPGSGHDTVAALRVRRGGARSDDGRQAASHRTMRADVPKHGLMQRFEDRWNRRRDSYGA